MHQHRFMDCNILNSLKENNTLLAKGWMEGLVHCHCIPLLHFELPTVTCYSSFINVLHFDSLPWVETKNSVLSVWAGRSMLGLFFLCLSWSCCILPEAAIQNGNCSIGLRWIRESTTGASSETASAFSIFTCQKIVDTPVESQIQDFQHGLRFRKYKYYYRWI